MPLRETVMRFRVLIESSLMLKANDPLAVHELEIRLGKMTSTGFDASVQVPTFFDCIRRAKEIPEAWVDPWRPMQDFYYELARANPLVGMTPSSHSKHRTRVAFCSCGKVQLEHTRKTRLAHFDEPLVGSHVSPNTPVIRGSLAREEETIPPDILLPNQVFNISRLSVFVPVGGKETKTIYGGCLAAPSVFGETRPGVRFDFSLVWTGKTESESDSAQQEILPSCIIEMELVGVSEWLQSVQKRSDQVALEAVRLLALVIGAPAPGVYKSVPTK